MATFEEIGYLIRQCCRYFERKEPGGDTLNLWSEELSDLESRHFPAVVKKFSKIDGWPKNYPMKVREIYRAVSKVGKNWTVEEFVKSYFRDHAEEINADAQRLGIDPMDMAWAEMTRPLVRKGDISREKAIYYWNRAKKGPLPDYLRRLDGEDIGQGINRFRREFAKMPQEVPF